MWPVPWRSSGKASERWSADCACPSQTRVRPRTTPNRLWTATRDRGVALGIGALVTIPLPANPRAGRRAATVTGLATLAFGFLAMAGYSLTGPAFGPLPTIWQSWGGTVGDLLLPLVVYSLIRGCQLLATPGSG